MNAIVTHILGSDPFERWNASTAKAWVIGISENSGKLIATKPSEAIAVKWIAVRRERTSSAQKIGKKQQINTTNNVEVNGMF